MAWIARLVTAALLLIPRIKPNLDAIHIWTDPLARRARIYSGIMLVCEIAVSYKNDSHCLMPNAYVPHLVIDAASMRFCFEGATSSTSAAGRLERALAAIVRDTFNILVVSRRDARCHGTRYAVYPDSLQQSRP